MAPKVADGDFRTDGKRGCLRNSPRKAVKCGNGLRWVSAGTTQALLWQNTVDQERYTTYGGR